MFSRYTLRTTDVEAARRFYELAIGRALPDGSRNETCLEVWPLHEQARRAGAPPHWLGHLDVADLDGAVAELVAMGAQPLGPTVQRADGVAWATLRDPFGAVVALRARGEAPPDRPIAWHQLHTRDLDRAWPTYAKLTGWRDAGTIDVADPEGGHRLFAWSPQGAAVGSVANTARWPGVHPHWCFYFPVEQLDLVVEQVRQHGGSALEPIALPGGDRIAVCEDPQGAAFGLFERASHGAAHSGRHAAPR